MSAANQKRVRDVMSTPLQTISRNATVIEATKKMREHDINALIVTTSPPSIITGTDVLDAVAQDRDVTTLKVSEVMTKSIETVPPDLGLQEVAAMMTNFGINHLPVVDDDYVGMVSSSDITEQMS